MMVFLIFITIAAVWYLLTAVPKRKLPRENGLMPRYQTICAGIRTAGFGFFGMGSILPFWRISLYDDFVVIAIFSPVMIEYSDIDSIRCRNWIVFSSVRIKSKKHRISFSAWVFKPTPMVSLLTARGVSNK
jgi:hypothetical protein